MNDVKRWYSLDGAVLVRVDWFDADGRVSQLGGEAVAPILVLADNAVGWISVEDVKPHAFHFDSATAGDGDEIVLVNKDALYRVVLSPLWLAEQRASVNGFSVPDDMKQELDEFVRQADEG